MLSMSELRSQNASNAPEYMSDSRDFLLITSQPVRSMISSMDSNLFSFTALRMVQIGPAPSHLIAPSPNRIVSLSIKVKCLRDSLISGGRILTHLDLASSISILIRSISSSSDTISATIDSVG